MKLAPSLISLQRKQPAPATLARRRAGSGLQQHYWKASGLTQLPKLHELTPVSKMGWLSGFPERSLPITWLPMALWSPGIDRRRIDEGSTLGFFAI